MEITKEYIKEKLSREDSRFLLNSITVTFPGFFDYVPKESTYDNLCRSKSSLENFKNPRVFKQLDYIHKSIKIHELFKSLGLCEKEYLNYWSKVYKDFQSYREHQFTMKPNERKDNNGYYSGSGNRHGKTIRLPKKKRKTAWKRFYKLFPSLNKKL